MTLFLATYINKLDRKGRISVPAPFRAALSVQAFQGIVLFRSSAHVCLEGFAMTRMEELGKKLDQLDMFSSAQDDLATVIFGDAVPLPFDGDGRVVLPVDLAAFAKIDEQAAFVGMGSKFQIWNPELLDARRAEARSRVKDQGLTLPGGGGGA